MRNISIPAATFLLAVAISALVGPGRPRELRALQSTTGSCVADAKVTGQTVTAKNWSFTLKNQPLDASCLNEGFTVRVKDTLTLTATGVVAFDFNHKKHVVPNPVVFTTDFAPPYSRNFDAGVYLAVETGPMQAPLAAIDAALQLTVVNLLAGQGIRVKRVQSRTYAAQEATIQATGSTTCNSGGAGTFTGRTRTLAVDNKGRG